MFFKIHTSSVQPPHVQWPLKMEGKALLLCIAKSYVLKKTRKFLKRSLQRVKDPLKFRYKVCAPHRFGFGGRSCL